METPTQSAKIIFPYFEKGFPLRSRDLNAVFRRAEEEVRHTRTCLHGMGILYGLHVAVETNKITIQAGAGVTSDGYLYCSHEEVILTEVKIYNPPHSILRRQFGVESFGDFLDSQAVQVKRDDALTKDQTSQTKAANDPRQDPITAVELVAGENRALPDLAGRQLIIFFEVVTEKLQGCANCEKGTRAEIQTKYLLIDKTTWDDLSIGGKRVFNCGNDESIDQTNTKVAPLPAVPRYGLIENCIGFSENKDLVEGYTATLGNGLIPLIKGVLTDLFDKLDSVFVLNGKNEVTKLDSLLPLTVANAQYVHDYLRLIVRAYNEFVTTPFTRHIANLPPETCFPKHLVLGEFDANGAFSEESRTPLYRPPFADATDADFEYARKLYERLINLLTNTDFGSLTTDAKKVLRITPSRRATFPIGTQAIPFYLKADEVRKTWRPASQFNELILSYDDKKQLQNQPFFDEADFYRIEGHVGQALTTDDNEKNEVENLRDCLNLPFQIQLVRLGGERGEVPSLAEFARQHPGLEHQGGVPAGGTFVLVVADEGNTVMGDFCLPYWVQPPAPKPLVADFEIDSRKTIPGQGESFTFVNTSKNYNRLTDRLEWRVDGGDSLSEEELFTFTFPVSDLLVTHYFVTLTAIRGDQESVEKTTIVVVHIKEKVPPPQADFAVEEKANVKMLDDEKTIEVTVMSQAEGSTFDIELAFENLSENAEKYQWFINGKPLSKPKTKDKLIHKFSWEQKDIGQKSYVVRLVASALNQKDSMVEKPVITTFFQPKQPDKPIQ